MNYPNYDYTELYFCKMSEMPDFDRFPTANLLRWYGLAKRDLPWRSIRDPYKIWISEVILQQTRVEQGTPYYHRFISAFPTVRQLADADEDSVLKLWEGLGYYSRARNLHFAAKQVVSRFDGNFPTAYSALLGLKGIGPYTAAAIASIAFGVPVACVDGNVTRVLARFHGLSEHVDSSTMTKLLDRLAQEALDREQPGEHNQAMMELGATVCLPRNPLCISCPLQSACTANRLRLTDSIPSKSKKTKVRERHFHYLVLSDGFSTIVQQRTSGDIWQGLFQFPLIEHEGPMQAEMMIAKYGIGENAIFQRSIGPVRHLLTHQRIFGYFHEFSISKLPMSIGRVHSMDKLYELAFPSSFITILRK
jgi:A/G-specific adenine glycosylase